MYGERVHQAVLESGMKVSGCTVHFVDEQYDTGPIVLQRAVPVRRTTLPPRWVAVCLSRNIWRMCGRFSSTRRADCA